MKRGEITWVDKIEIIRDEASKRPKVTVEGLWSGRDRKMISRMLLKQMRLSSNKVIQEHKRADLTEQKKEQDKLDIKEKRLEALAKAREAKKLKKLEEEKENVRGQRKQKQ